MNRASLFLLITTLGCSGARSECAAICGGCCQTDGRCAPGTLENACGSGGLTCTACAAGTRCMGGACVVFGNAGGSATAGGSGTAGSGGSGGGMLSGPGDVTFRWTFEAQGCAAAQISTVRIAIPGHTLANGGVYPCEQSGTAGILLRDFAPGTYAYTIEGRVASGATTHQHAAQFVVNGDVTVPVDLVQQANASRLQWTFPPNGASQTPTCTQAGVTTMEVTLDSDAPYSVACAEGQTGQGATTQPLSLGMHLLRVRGLDGTGYRYYEKTTTFAVAAGAPQTHQVDLDWAVGGTNIRWTLFSNSVTTTCLAAGVSTVYVNFRDASGTFVYAGAGDAQPCAAGTGGSVPYSFLMPGTYAVFLQAAGAGSTTWQSSTTSPPMVTVTAGNFPAAATAPNIALVRQ